MREPDDRGAAPVAAPRLHLPPVQRTAVIGIIVAAAAVRIAVVLWAAPDPPAVIGDPYLYYSLGQQLADGDGYVDIVTGEPTAYYPIGYPAFLASVFWVVQHTPIPDDLPLTSTLVQALLGAASVGLVFLIARRIAGVHAGLAAAAVTAGFPSLVLFTATLQLETVFSFMALAALAILVVHDWSRPPSLRRLLAFGLVLGMSAIIRPFSIPFVVAPAVAVVVAGFGWRRGVQALGIALAATAVLVVPWVVRNATVMDAAVISTNTGDTVCLDRHDGATGGFQWADHAGCAPPEWEEARRNKRSTELAVRYVLDDPLRELRQIGTRAKLMYSDDEDGLVALEAGKSEGVFGERGRNTVRAITNWYFRIALVLGVVGLAALVAGLGVPGARPARAVAATAATSLVLIPLGLWGATRFHVPVLPFVAIGAGVALSTAWRVATAPRTLVGDVGSIRPAGTATPDEGARELASGRGGAPGDTVLP